MQFSNKGYSLMEIIVVLAIVSLMGLGTTTLVTNMLKLNQKTLMKSNLLTVKDMIEKTLKNDRAWMFSICRGNNPTPPPAGPGQPCLPANNPNQLSCLWDQDNVRCNDGAAHNNDLRLYNRNGELVYDSSVPTRGWNLDGSPCNTFGAPDDNCPFRYNFAITLVCPPTENPCLKPDIQIDATAVISTATSESPARRIDVNNYVISFKRDQEVKYEPLQVEHLLTGSNSNGDCNDGARVVRPLNRIAYDVGGNIVTDDLAANNRFQLAPGEYDCEVYATGYAALGGFLIELQAGGTYHPIGTGFSDLQSSATVVGTADLSLATNSWVRITHLCGPGSDQPYPVNQSYEMGIPTSNYAAGNILTRVTCVRKR